MKPRRPSFWFALVFSLVCLAANARCIKQEPKWIWDYDGSIGDHYRIRMTLVFDGDQVSGQYFYASQLKDITLKGHLTDGTDLVLDELGADGRPTARFEGRFADTDPRGKFNGAQLACEVIVGAWHKLDATDKLAVYLSMTSGQYDSLQNRYASAGADDDERINRRAAEFRNAVKRGDKKAVAALVAYPIQVNLPTGRSRIRHPAQFIAAYDAIFSSRFRQAIEDAIPRAMFARDQGIMMGSGGEIWFGADGKVIALNNY